MSNEQTEKYSQQEQNREGNQDSRHKNPGRLRGAFVPLALVVTSILAWSGFQTAMLYREWDTQTVIKSNQEAQMQQSQKLRTSLDSLASEMGKLADKGNPNAQLVVAELRKRGVTIRQ